MTSSDSFLVYFLRLSCVLFYIILHSVTTLIYFNRLNNSCHSLLLFFLGASANQLHFKASVDESRRSGSKTNKPFKRSKPASEIPGPISISSSRSRYFGKRWRKELCGWTAKFTLVACGKDLNFGHICSFGVPSMRKCLSI